MGMNRSRRTRPQLLIEDAASAPGAGTRAAGIQQAALELFASKGYRSTTMGDIGERVGVRGPSLYRHVSSKQQVLVEIMAGTMERLLAAHQVATRRSSGPVEGLQRAAEAHARYHAGHRLEAFVGNREIDNLEEPWRTEIVNRRSAYEKAFRKIIEAGREAGIFTVESSRLASFAILDMGMGISLWYRPGGALSESEVAAMHGRFALRLVGAMPPSASTPES